MILALESSGQTASVAVVKDGYVVCESTQTTGFFHSQVLMVLLNNMISTAKVKLTDLNLVAVSIGPGSFTGLRIGVSAAKGLATGLGICCVGISTLRVLAANFWGLPIFVCALIDARNDFFYFGLFDMETGVQIGQDEVVDLDSLFFKLQNLNLKKPIFLVGDGAHRCYGKLQDQGFLNLHLAQGRLNLASAASLGLCAKIDKEEFKLNTKFKLNYLRQPQAQRLLKEKEKQHQKSEKRKG